MPSLYGFRVDKKPLIAFRFRNTKNPRKSVDLIAMDKNDFVELMEKIYG